MNPISRSIAALALLAGVAPVMAENNTAPANSTGDSRNDPDRMVCKTQDQIGSHLRKRKVCMTVAEWREQAFRTGQQIDRRTAEMPKPGG